MRITLKYGLSIAAAVAVWTILVHLLVTNPDSKIHSLGTVFFFNFVQFAGIYFGIRAMERTVGQPLIFKHALKTGVSISFYYAFFCTLFFICVLLLAGTSFMRSEPGSQSLPKWLLITQAFTGLILLTTFFGLVYSTVISFALAKRRSKPG